MMCNVSTLDDAERELFNLNKLKESSILWDLRRERDALNVRIADLERGAVGLNRAEHAAGELAALVGKRFGKWLTTQDMRWFVIDNWDELKRLAHIIHESRPKQ
jgi:hypothetical protein